MRGGGGGGGKGTEKFSWERAKSCAERGARKSRAGSGNNGRQRGGLQCWARIAEIEESSRSCPVIGLEVLPEALACLFALLGSCPSFSSLESKKGCCHSLAHSGVERVLVVDDVNVAAQIAHPKFDMKVRKALGDGAQKALAALGWDAPLAVMGVRPLVARVVQSLRGGGGGERRQRKREKRPFGI